MSAHKTGDVVRAAVIGFVWGLVAWAIAGFLLSRALFDSDRPDVALFLSILAGLGIMAWYEWRDLIRSHRPTLIGSV
jgi:hypothetical protein